MKRIYAFMQYDICSVARFSKTFAYAILYLFLCVVRCYWGELIKKYLMAGYVARIVNQRNF